jgi:hypothetical protein
MLALNRSLLSGNCDSLVGRATGCLVISNFVAVLYLRHNWDTCVGIKEKMPKKTKLNFMACIRERTIPIEGLPLVGEVSANICG